MHVLLNSISVARNSAQYWDANFDIWINEFGKKEKSPMGKISWGKAGAADAAAAISVGVITSTVLIVPFVGWGTWATITGSATAVVSGSSVALNLFYA